MDISCGTIIYSQRQSLKVPAICFTNMVLLSVRRLMVCTLSYTDIEAPVLMRSKMQVSTVYDKCASPEVSVTFREVIVVLIRRSLTVKSAGMVTDG
jgi:hypothetical protein